MQCDINNQMTASGKQDEDPTDNMKKSGLSGRKRKFMGSAAARDRDTKR